MKVELFPFQKMALYNLRTKTATALGAYRNTRTSQVISFTAPTGSGKTIILSALIEAIYRGDELFPEQPEAIFVWLSDSPELNQQSKDKIDLKADKIKLSQCVTITDDSFDQEMLEDGHIYFLNTQKLGKSSNLTKQGDGRTYTIWETLQNTMDEKYDRLYFIIDEAHRGMQGQAAAKATTIMQKFLKGSREDHLHPAPLVIGVTATPERFNRLIEGTESTILKVVVSTDDVRQSGLLKDRIIIAYPDDPSGSKDMAVLQAAADDWKQKWDHWYQYCQDQHYGHVNPVFVIQVQNQTGSSVSDTNLGECLEKIEERTGFRFKTGEVVHTFGQTTSTLTLNGIEVKYVEPSHIAEDRNIRVVFFKENLSTGWDCPRAETMMSFRRAVDSTYIAQLLGRMIRTPLQRHIQVDDVLNDVHLYLPYFDSQTVEDVVSALQSSEGGDIPADIHSESFTDSNTEVWSVRPHSSTPSTSRPGGSQTQIPSGIGQQGEIPIPYPPAGTIPAVPVINERPSGANTPDAPDLPLLTGNPVAPAVLEHTPSQSSQGGNSIPSFQTHMDETGIDRMGILKAINQMGILTYEVRHVQISNYLKSLMALAHLLTQSHLAPRVLADIHSEIVEMIHQHIKNVKDQGQYEELTRQVMQFKMKTQAFDVFGEAFNGHIETDLFSSTDLDIERRFRAADPQLGNEGIGNKYGNKYYDEEDPNAYKIDVIIFASDPTCINDLHEYAKQRFNDLRDEYRRRIATLTERYRTQFKTITSESDIISPQNLELPVAASMGRSEGDNYPDHLYLDPNGKAYIQLNSWEKAVLEAERRRPDFVCWLRNLPRKYWALCIPYEQNGENKAMYPDFLIIRKDELGYIVDILEPHDSSLNDNLGKAKGFAKYAKEAINNTTSSTGRIQLIRIKSNGAIRRLDLSKAQVRDQVLHCGSDDQLNFVFDNFGFTG